MTLKEWRAYVTDDANWTPVAVWASTGWTLYRLQLPNGVTEKELWLMIKYYDDALHEYHILRICGHEYWQLYRPGATGMCAGNLSKYLWNLERGRG